MPKQDLNAASAMTGTRHSRFLDNMKSILILVLAGTSLLGCEKKSHDLVEQDPVEQNPVEIVTAEAPIERRDVKTSTETVEPETLEKFRYPEDVGVAVGEVDFKPNRSSIAEFKESLKNMPRGKTYTFSDLFPNGITRINLELLDVSGVTIDIFGTSQKYYEKDIISFIDPKLESFLQTTYNVDLDSNSHLNLTVIHYVPMRSTKDEKFYHLPIADQSNYPTGLFGLADQSNYPTALIDSFPCKENAICPIRLGRVTQKNSGHFFAKFEKQDNDNPVNVICFVGVHPNSRINTPAKFQNAYSAHLNNCLNFFADKMTEEKDADTRAETYP